MNPAASSSSPARRNSPRIIDSPSPAQPNSGPNGQVQPEGAPRSRVPAVDAAGAPIYKVRQMAAGHTAAAVLYKNGIPTASKEIKTDRHGAEGRLALRHRASTRRALKPAEGLRDNG